MEKHGGQLKIYLMTKNKNTTSLIVKVTVYSMF